MKIWYKIDFEKLVNDLFSRLTSLSEMVALMKCIFEPFKRVQETALYRMQHNGETIYLEKVLNDFLLLMAMIQQTMTVLKRFTLKTH